MCQITKLPTDLLVPWASPEIFSGRIDSFWGGGLEIYGERRNRHPSQLDFSIKLNTPLSHCPSAPPLCQTASDLCPSTGVVVGHRVVSKKFSPTKGVVG